MGFKPNSDDGLEIRATPDTSSPILITIFGGPIFGTGKSITDATGLAWVNVLIPPGFTDGWVRRDQADDAPDPGLVPVDPEMFVRQCTLVDRSLNADPKIASNAVTADFLIARAIIETGMTQKKFSLPILDGLLRLAQSEWSAFQNSGLEVASSFSAADSHYPLSQVYAAGFSMHLDGQAFADAANAADFPANDPLVPSYLDLFHCYLFDAKTALALRQNENGPSKTLAAVGVSASQINAITKRPRLAQVSGAMSIVDFVALSEALLSEALNTAFANLKTMASDELPPDQPQTGTTPWFDVAAKEADAKITEARNADRIRSYFAATDFGSVGGSDIPAWCGAFAAFCMHQVGGDVPKGAARAANWKSWGQRTVPVQSHTVPPGAVVVMAPSPGTGSSGHVAFFVETAADGQHLTLLGGNQSNAVTRSSGFRVARVAIIRALESDSASLGAANTFDMTAAGVPKGRQRWGDRIVDRFTRAGVGKPQHLVTALANAIAESNLDPRAQAGGGEQSFGLFQCNRTHGLGVGFTIDQLMDPDTNIGIILKHAKSVGSFVAASTTAAAMAAFVTFIERPKDQQGAIRTRMAIAAKLL